MERTFQIKSLTHEELVDLFSTATYSNDYMTIAIPDEFESLAEGECREDRWASVLEKGGQLIVADADAEPTDEPYGLQGVNWLKTEPIELYRTSWLGEQKFESMGYRINMETLLRGLSNDKASKYIQELFVDEDGDFYTAYNLMQIAVFGDIIYG